MLSRAFILVFIVISGAVLYPYPKPSVSADYEIPYHTYPQPSVSVVVVSAKADPLTPLSVLGAVNAYRATYGLRPLYYSARLQTSSNCQLGWLIKDNAWAHSWPGHAWEDCFTGIPGWWGENLGSCFYTTQSLMKAWEVSPDHRANLVNPNFSKMAVSIGFYPSINCPVVVQHFSS